MTSRGRKLAVLRHHHDEAAGTLENALTDGGARKSAHHVKTAAQKVFVGEDCLYNRRFLQMGGHGCVMIFCAPTLPDLNEGAVFYFRESVHQHGREAQTATMEIHHEAHYSGRSR